MIALRLCYSQCNEHEAHGIPDATLKPLGRLPPRMLNSDDAEDGWVVVAR